MTTRTKILFLLFMCSTLFVNAQDTLLVDTLKGDVDNNDNDIFSTYNVVIPPQPSVFNFAVRGNNKVNLFSGVPEITIPLWELKERDITVPIVLSYNAQGLKVNDIPSWVGAGWSLQPGGLITRTVRGIPDEDFSDVYQGIFHLDKYIDLEAEIEDSAVANVHNHRVYAFLEKVYRGKHNDMQPDEFYFNFGNYSGRFVYSVAHKKFICMSYQKLQIKIYPENKVDEIDSFRIKTPDGYYYYFTVSEITNTMSSSSKAGSLDLNFKSTWYLSKIVSPLGAIVRFEYESETMYQKSTVNNVTRHLKTEYGVGSVCFGGVDATTQSIERVCPRLRAITSNTKRVEFVPATLPRTDISELGGNGNSDKKISYALREVQIFNNNSNEKKCVRKFIFDSNYSIGKETKIQRLTLVALREQALVANSNEFEEKPPYLFEYYNPQDYPGLEEPYNYDHWGFYNGDKNEGATNVAPIIKLKKRRTYNSSGCIREADPEFVSCGNLASITYPTGGKTQYYYEANKVDNYKVDLSELSFPPTKNNNRAELVLASLVGTGVRDFNVDKGLYTGYKITISKSGGGDGGNNGVYYKTETPDDVVSGTIKLNEIELYDGDGSNLPKTMYVDNNIIIQGTNILEVGIKGVQTQITATSNSSGSGDNNGLDLSNSEIEGVYVGGARIKQIKDFNSDGKLINNRTFEYSGGKIFAIPVYIYTISNYEWTHVSSRDYLNLDNLDYYLRISSNNLSHNGIVAGTHVGYTEVTEKAIGANNNYTKEKTHFYNLEKNISYIYPYLPYLNYSPKIGKITNKKYYSTDKLIKEDIYAYLEENGPSIYAIKLGKRHYLNDFLCTDAGGERIPTYLDAYPYEYYHYESKVANLVSKETVEYLDAGEFRTKVDYEYNDSNFVSKIITNTSEGKLEVQKFYPFDSQAASIPSGMPNVLFSPIVEQKIFKNSDLIKHDVINFKKWSVGNRVFYKPQNTSTYNFLNNIFEEVTRFEAYDANGNPVQYRNKEDVPICIIWDYSGNYPILKMENVKYSDVENYLSDQELNAIKDNSADNSGIINKLRNHFKQANIYSYTYTIWGITSETGPDGETVYYEYDNFGRLLNIKNTEGHILKSTITNYAKRYEN